MNERLDNAFDNATESESTEHGFEDNCLDSRAIVPLGARIGRRADRAYRSGILGWDSDTAVCHRHRSRNHLKLPQKQHNMVKRDFRLSDHRLVARSASCSPKHPGRARQ